MQTPEAGEAALDRLALGQVRHELLTPLTAIIGFAGILLDDENDGTLGDGAREMLAEIQAGATEMAAEINRRKEPLEAYPVDSMAMVGSVTRNGRPYALLKVDNLLYQVKQGDYLGQNYGKITKISETDVTYREIVQDAAGEWIERNSALQLQERAR